MQHPFISSELTPNWSLMTPDHVKPDIEHALAQAQKNLDTIANQDYSSLNYENTLHALDRSCEVLCDAWSKVNHLDSVNNSPELREAVNTMLPPVSDFFTSISLNPKLWATLKAYSQTPEAQALTGQRQRHLEETLQDFRDSGADLSDSDKKKLESINAELAQHTQKYSENVLDATNAWELVIDNPADLAGLPQSAIDAALEDAIKKEIASKDSPKWRFTLQVPSLLPLMKHLDNDELREQAWRASAQVGHEMPYDNTELIGHILKLRQDKAELLGAKDFADLTLKRRMAKDGKTALTFTEDLHSKIEDRFLKEVDTLEAYKANQVNDSQERLQPWEIAYWSEKQRKDLYAFDEEELRQYFPMDSVISGMFQIVEKLYKIKITEKPGTQGWHPETTYYELHDHDGSMLGGFYTDWYPRETKRGGAWMNGPLTGEPGQPHMGLMCGNMTRPLEDKPALLDHREVETVFHEFGHLLHHLLSDVQVKSFHGTEVSWDFVELPSQIMENWCWDKQSLDIFARHYKTGDPIPDDLFSKMKAARNYHSAIGTMRQLSIGKMDLELHINFKDSHKSLDTFVDDVLGPYIPKTKTKSPSLLRRLGHVFGDPTGYAAGYYSYKWAEVLDADAFTRFEKEGILNEEVGIDFREKILSKGNSEPADKLFRDFMGRDPQLEPLLKRSGLLD